ncbi:ABC transporter G family member 10-like [Impatiens glandulifera]|uniref:ABC transporter G family member 10-like n=1 Tax=Impatiens glandulifera TaxID=253017 RepID=UPI001FB1101A|nr:ABC transporter G family member 10-like [Impatiens glandulifera]
MELPMKNVQYRIRTQNLSFKLLCPKYIEFDPLACWEENKECEKYILRNVNMEANPGAITAIVGPSGAGKTTLLEILAGVITPTTNHVLVNELPMNSVHFRKISGYVTQDDALFPLLTVRETLMYSARLRLEGGTKRSFDRVTELIKELGLEHVANVRIGSDSRRGISGGEKRRVSIGVDLVHDPCVLLLDEPTSGLDSSSALHVVCLLKSMAKSKGKTIVLTIHQPGFRILDLLDHFVLLSEGILIHHGSLDMLNERIKHLGYCIPRQVSAIEFAIEVIDAFVDLEKGVVQFFNESKQERCELRANHVDVIAYHNSIYYEVLILSQRFSRNIFRTNELFAARILQALLVGILIGTIFTNMNNGGPNRFKLRDELGFFAFTLTFLLSSTTEALPIFLEERRIMTRETSRGAYRISSYVISNALIFLPFLLIIALLYSIPVYWLVGLRRSVDGFLYFSLVAWLVVLMSNSFVAFFSALVPNFVTGYSMIAGVMGAFFLFSGYFIGKEDIPRYWLFMHYLSLFKYPFECLMINEYGGDHGKNKCLQVELGQCLLNGEGFLMQQGLKESLKWRNVVVMLIFIIGYRLLCAMVLCYRNHRTRC